MVTLLGVVPSTFPFQQIFQIFLMMIICFKRLCCDINYINFWRQEVNQLWTINVFLPIDLRASFVMTPAHWLVELPAALVTLTLYSYAVYGVIAADRSKYALGAPAATETTEEIAVKPWWRRSISYPVRTPLGMDGGDHESWTEVGVGDESTGGDWPLGAERENNHEVRNQTKLDFIKLSLTNIINNMCERKEKRRESMDYNRVIHWKPLC